MIPADWLSMNADAVDNALVSMRAAESAVVTYPWSVVSCVTDAVVMDVLSA